MPSWKSQYLNFRGKKRSPCRANSSSKEWLCCHFSFLIFQSKLQSLASARSLSCQAGWAHRLENKPYTPATTTLKHWWHGSLAMSCSKTRGVSMREHWPFQTAHCQAFNYSTMNPLPSHFSQKGTCSHVHDAQHHPTPQRQGSGSLLLSLVPGEPCLATEDFLRTLS